MRLTDNWVPWNHNHLPYRHAKDALLFNIWLQTLTNMNSNTDSISINTIVNNKYKLDYGILLVGCIVWITNLMMLRHWVYIGKILLNLDCILMYKSNLNKYTNTNPKYTTMNQIIKMKLIEFLILFRMYSQKLDFKDAIEPEIVKFSDFQMSDVCSHNSYEWHI